MASPLDTRPEENANAVTSSPGILMLKRWLQMLMRKSNVGPALHEPDRVPRRSRRAANHQSRSHSPARMEGSNVGPSRMAATKRVPVSALP